MVTLLPTLGLLLPLAQQPGGVPTEPLSPNDPGILDPVVAELLHRAHRLPATHQVGGNSELLNLVGSVRRKRAKGSTSATGMLISEERSAVDSVDRELENLVEAAQDSDLAEMRAAAALLAGLLNGTTAGRISDGFPLLHDHRGGWMPDHVPGAYRTKRLADHGLTFVDEEGDAHAYWEVTWRLMWTEAGAESDLALLQIPIDAHPEDRILVHYEIYASAADDCAPMSHVADADLPNAHGLPFKALDASWVRLREDHIHEFSVDHGAVGTLRRIGVRGWRVQPEPLARVELLREQVDAHTGLLGPTPRAEALAAAAQRATFDSIGLAAPERKILAVVDAVDAGASPAQVLAMTSDVQTLPLGVWQEWTALVGNRGQLPREVWQALAAEGIRPGATGPRPLGPYDHVAVLMNHEWYGLSARDAGAPAIDPQAAGRVSQGAQRTVKLFNLDALGQGVRMMDYGPALHDDFATCYNAPHGGKSLEIFSDKPIHGAPKSHELQWRAGWGLRPGAGILGQYDLLPRRRDRALALSFRDSFGGPRTGWQYPAAWRGGDFRVLPPLEVLGRPGRAAAFQLQEADGSAGLVIGTRTPGYGIAQMAAGDLGPLHPGGLLNTDTDGDQVLDALIFPAWLRNPDAGGGDLILDTPEWAPFQWRNPHNGSVWVDPADPGQGLWATQTYAAGAPLDAGSAQRIDWLRPRALGQGVWLEAGTLTAHGAYPLEMRY